MKRHNRYLFRLIESTPNLDWLLLTKRIGNVTRMVPEATDLIDYGEGWQSLWGQGEWPDHVWLGATICNQEEADRDIPKLLAVPAKVRWISAEPLLGPVDLTNVAPPVTEGREWHGIDSITPANRELRGCIDWVVCGGESGANARPIHPDWARSLRDQCAAAGVPFLFKQWGEWAAYECGTDTFKGNEVTLANTGKAWPRSVNCYGGRIEGRVHMRRVGKAAAGRLLDGVLHDAYPEARS